MITNEIYPFLQAYALIIGLVVGSFLNVVIYRIPNNKSIVKPRSKCTGCENKAKYSHPLMKAFMSQPAEPK